MAQRRIKSIKKRRHTALVLQGGGALGAYQAGVYEKLFATDYAPDWVAGVSIGAINSALIVGNPPERRIERLREFWELVSSGVSSPPPPWQDARAAFNRASAMYAATVGVPGFYRPRSPIDYINAPGGPGVLGIYDTTPLRETLERLVDFDLINSKRIRLSMGAVNVVTGNSIYFDNQMSTIGPEHVMASGALPPAFAPVIIDGEPYWDGGILSNTPLQYVLDSRGDNAMLVFQVDLFSARGAMPTDLSEVLARQKEIQYSSRTRFNTDTVAKIQNQRRATRELLMSLPQRTQTNATIEELKHLLRSPATDIVHLIYRGQAYEEESRDYEFSRASVEEHWQCGLRDMSDTLSHPGWLSVSGLDDGVTTYDLTRPSARPKKK